MNYTHASLFSGIGGFDLAAEDLGFENLFFAENNAFCSKVLQKNVPNVPNLGDITNINYEDLKQYIGKVTFLSAGFPCQPFSIAGQRKGQQDERIFFDQLFQIVATVRPKFFIGENVSGITSMDSELSYILDGLESSGYQTALLLLPASSVGAWHKRERAFFISYPSCTRKQGSFKNSFDTGQNPSIPSDRIFEKKDFAGTLGLGAKGLGNGLSSPQFFGRDDGLPKKLDGIINLKERPKSKLAFQKDEILNRGERIKALGNAVVPQLAKVIFQILVKFNENHDEPTNF